MCRSVGRSGTLQILQQAIEAEVQGLLLVHLGRLRKDGRVGVERNRYLSEREIQTGTGPVTLQVPRIRAKTGRPISFRSALVPPYVRKTSSMEAALPWLYLKGVSTDEIWQAHTRENAA